MRTTVTLIGAAAIVCMSVGSMALAHGEKEKTNPKEDATVASPPRTVSVTLTEPPTDEAVLEVTDGCRRDVVDDVSVDGRTVRAAIGRAQPGRWRARFRVVSAVDGHPTADDWAFTVRGTRDCSSHEGHSGAEESPGGGSAAPDDGGGAGDDEFPVVPVALGAAGLLVLALIVRMTASR